MATANNVDVRKRARALRRGANAAFMDVLEENSEGDLFSPLTTRFRSSNAKEDFSWITSFAQVTPWDGDRESSDFKAYGFTVEPEHFQVDIPIDANDLADERLSMYTRQIQERVTAFRRHRRLLIAKRLANAFSVSSGQYNAYDGKALISDSHPIHERKGDPDEDRWIEAGTQSNVISDGTTDHFKLAKNFTTAEVIADKIYPEFRQMKGNNGILLNVSPDTVVVPTTMESTARTVFTDEMILDEATGEMRPNPAEGPIDRILTDPQLDARGFTDGFFLLDTTSPVIMPFIFLERQGVQTDSLLDNSDQAYHTNKFHYGADARYDIIPGHYEGMMGSDGSGGTL